MVQRGRPEQGEPESVRASVSRGIIAEAVATAQVVLTPSALLDPRFRDRASVKHSRIDAVLCVPIGKDPLLGVLYLQSQTPQVFDQENGVTQSSRSRATWLRSRRGFAPNTPRRWRTR